jgi:aryl-alcohol dehydrogenase-like predicted oxidoreductase
VIKSLSYRKLGSSDLRVSPIGLGCWQFSKGQGMSGKFWPNLADEEIEDIVRVSLEGGINWFDTAEAYGSGQSERALAAALKKFGKTSTDVIIATKWMPLFRTAKSILKTIDRRAANLEGFRIDLYQIHHPISISSAKAQMKAMARLVEEQKIRHIGVSNFSAKKMLAAHKALSEFGLGVASNQVHYSLLNRKIETNGVLDAAKDHGISIIAYSPLEQGILSGKFHDDSASIRRLTGPRKYRTGFKPKGLEKSRPVIEALRGISEKHRASPAQVALNWLIHVHGDTVVAIPGATKAGQARDNVEAMSFKLTADEMDSLDRASALFKK